MNNNQDTTQHQANKQNASVYVKQNNSGNSICIDISMDVIKSLCDKCLYMNQGISDKFYNPLGIQKNDVTIDMDSCLSETEIMRMC